MDGRTHRRVLRPAAAFIAPALVCFGVSAFLALRMPVLLGADEGAHLLYAASVLDGHLPEFTTDHGANDRVPIIDRALGQPPREDTRGVWVAYHPPLAYAVSAPFVGVAGELGPYTWPALAMRAVNAAAMATGVVFAGLFASEAFPTRRRVGFAAACITAVVPNVAAVGAAGHNDGVAFALSAASLWVAAAVIRKGPSRRLLLAACGVAAADMLARVSLAPSVALLAGAVLLGALRQRPRKGATARALCGALAVGASALVASGWFYWRNYQLYGSFFSAPHAGWGRPSPGSLFDILTRSTFHRGMWAQLYASVHARLVFDRADDVLIALVAVLALGLVLAIWRRWRTVRGTSASFEHGDGAFAGNPAPDAPTDGIGALGWALVACACAAIVIQTAWFHSQGGGAHSRYLLGVVPVVSALLARAIDELPWPRLALAVVVAGLGGVLVSQLRRFPALIASLIPVRPFDAPAVGAGARAAPVVLALTAAAVSIWVAVKLDRRASASAPTPATPRRAPARGTGVSTAHEGVRGR
ncbi:MAG: hypothetical protein ACRDZ0_12590 [Acidimicrobiales bacterium]